MRGHKRKAASKRSRALDSEMFDQNTFEDEKVYLTNNAKFFPELVRKLDKLFFSLSQYHYVSCLI